MRSPSALISLVTFAASRPVFALPSYGDHSCTAIFSADEFLASGTAFSPLTSLNANPQLSPTPQPAPRGPLPADPHALLHWVDSLQCLAQWTGSAYTFVCLNVLQVGDTNYLELRLILV